MSYHHGNLRRELISEGIKMLNRDGINSFSLRKLSKELGVSHAAAYRHFSDKEELLHEIFMESAKMFNKALSASQVPGVSGKEALVQVGIAYVRFFIDHPEILGLFSLMSTKESGLYYPLQVGSKQDESYDSESLEMDEAFNIFKITIDLVQESAEREDLNEHELLLGYWSKIHGMATILVNHRDRFLQDQLEKIIERVIRAPI